MNLIDRSFAARSHRIAPRAVPNTQPCAPGRQPSGDTSSMVRYQTAHRVAQEAGRLRAAHRYWQRKGFQPPLHRSRDEQSDNVAHILHFDPWLLVIVLLAYLLLSQMA